MSNLILAVSRKHRKLRRCYVSGKILRDAVRFPLSRLDDTRPFCTLCVSAWTVRVERVNAKVPMEGEGELREAFEERKVKFSRMTHR